MRIRQARTVVAVLLLALGATACAARQVPTGLSAYYISGQADQMPPPAPRRQASDLAAYVKEVRRQTAEAMAGRERKPLPQVETTDPSLMRALADLAERPSAAAHFAVATEYRRLKIHDFAIEHANEALRLSPRDAAVFDLKARTWRDLGLLGPAVADANRAVYFAPRSAAAQNTLGTTLMLLGRRNEARVAFEKALRLDPRAAYAWSNLCYVDAAEGELEAARLRCTAALELDPSLAVARRHLQAVDAQLSAARNP